MNAIFTDNITDKLINYSRAYNYDIKLLKPVNSKFHFSFNKYLNYNDFLNYKKVIVVTDDNLICEKAFNFNNEDTVGVLRDTYSNKCSNVSMFVKAINVEFVTNNPINTDMIVYNNISQFVALFQRIETFCKLIDKPYLFGLSGNKTTTPNFLSPGLEKELFTYFCGDMYHGFKLHFL